MTRSDRTTLMRELKAVLELTLTIDRCQRSRIMTASHYDLDRDLEERQQQLITQLHEELKDATQDKTEAG